MAARQIQNGTALRAASAEDYWSHCEAALAGSRITVAASDLDGRYTWVYNAPDGLPDQIIGKLDSDILMPEEAQLLAGAKREVMESEQPREIELQILGDRGPRWYDVRIRAESHHGRIVGTVSSFIDVTDRKVQEEHLRIVLRELAHRSKNLLAVIQGIARQTAESASSPTQFVSRFNGRIFSLSRAHDVLTDADWRGARIFDLVRSQIALYAEDRLGSVQIEGENGFLRPNAAQYVGLALHELTTNALKYGALSRAEGRVAVRFERSASAPDFYHFAWHETGGADLREPKVRSFGLMMLTEVVPTSVSGTAALTFARGGLRYELDIPKAQLVG
jgi:two-component sensor histidine kinase